jgi:hypothetical protein
MEKKIEKFEGGLKEAKTLRIHPMWYAFIKYCETLGYGEIQKLRIENGLPVGAEEVKKKIKFS